MAVIKKIIGLALQLNRKCGSHSCTFYVLLSHISSLYCSCVHVQISHILFETFSFSDQQSCDPGEFLCHDHVTCVSQSWLCDGDPDCPDDSDESLDTCE